jgi:hypothetical protein
MAQRESRLSRQIMKTLRTELKPCFCFKVHGSEFMMAGLPDIVGVCRGLFFSIETKVAGKEGNVSAVQELVHAKIRRAGGIVIVTSSASDALEQLRSQLESRLTRPDMRDDA